MSARPWNEKPFRDALRIELAAVGPDQKALRTIAAAIYQRAIAGDMAAASMIIERTDGKVPQAHIGDSEHDPIQIQGISWLGDQTVHDVTQNGRNPRDITHEPVTENGRSQTQIPPFRPKVTIETAMERKRKWAKEHMRKKRAAAKLAASPEVPDEA